tara:strand:+ start:93 stop:344 length:252 start_codon:yes stop_codon:yes gene_type:complete
MNKEDIEQMQLSHHLEGGVNYFIYSGDCNGIQTKWITTGEWDGEIKTVLHDGELTYLDSNNNKMLVYEDDEQEYYNWPGGNYE